MANDELLNSFADLQEADRQFDYLEKKVEKYVADIAAANKVKINVSGSLSDMAKGAEKVVAANQTVVDSYGELTSVVKVYENMKAQFNGSTEKVIAGSAKLAQANLTEAKTATEAAKASEKNARAKEIEARYTIALTKEKERLEKQQQKESAAAAKLENDYEILKRAYIEAANRAKNLGVTAGTNSVAFKEASAAAMQMHQALLKVETAVGQSQRNVGNYTSALMSMSQVIREAPAFANGLRTGLSAIGNNMPILIDEFKKLKEEVGSNGKAIKIMAGSLFSFTNIFTLAFTALQFLQIYLSNTKKATDEFGDSLRDLDKQAKSSAAEEMSRVNSLVNIAKDETAIREVRLRAVKELQSKYPDYLGNLKEEAILSGNITKEVEKLNEALFNKALMDSSTKKIGAVADKWLEVKEKLDDAYKTQQKYTKEVAALEAQAARGGSVMDRRGGFALTEYRLKLKSATSDVRELTAQQYLLELQSQKFAKDRDEFARKAGFAAVDSPNKGAKGDEIAGINSLLEAQKRLESATAELAKQRFQQEAEANKAIFDDENRSLNDRLTAYGNYQANMINIAMIEEAKEEAIIQDKLKAIEAKEALYRAGKLKLDANGLKALEVDTAALNTELLAKKEVFETKLNQMTAEGIVKRQAIRNSDRAKQRQEEKEWLTEVQTGLEDRIAGLQDSYNVESTVIAQNYLDRKISEKEFREELKKLRNKYDIEELDLQIANDALLLQQAELSAEARLAVERRLNANRKKKTDKQTEGAGLDKVTYLGMAKEDWDNSVKVANEAIELNQELVGLLDQKYQKELDALDEKRKKIDEVAQAEIDAINRSMLSDAEKEKKIAAIKGQAAAQDKQLQQEQNAIKRKAAIAEKEANIAAIIQKTAIAVISAYAELPPPFDVIAATGIALVGATQLARAIATPIPQYAVGTQDHPGGLARVGEAGPEAIVEPGKAPYMVNSDRIMNLPKHTRVIPERDFIASNMGFMTGNLLRTIEAGNSINMNMAVDNSRLEAVTKQGFDRMEGALKNLPQTQYVQKYGDIYRVVKRGASSTTYINKHS